MGLKCAQMVKPYFEVQGSAKKPYRVVMFQDNVLPSCTCTGYMTKRNKNANIAGGGYAGAGKGLANSVTAWCKHLAKIEKETCQWKLAEGEIPPSRCPRCGGPVVDDKGLPVVTDVASATTDLVAMMRDLAGAAPAPDPVLEEENEDDEPEPDQVIDPAPPTGNTSFDPNSAVAELAALLKSK